MTVALLLAASYLLGALPTSYVAGRWARGVDLRHYGSGNLGATNAFRVLGWRVALGVFLIDVWKGWFPTFVFPRLDGAAAEGWALAYGAAAILGHVYSVFVGLKGGKGVATSAGVFLALAPVALVAGLAVWGLVLWLGGIVSVASMTAALALPVAVALTRGIDAVFWIAVAAATLVIIGHRGNLKRLLRGEESRIRRKAENSS